MKLHDLGRSYKESMPVMVAKDKKTYPTLHLTTEQFPPLRGKEVGDTCRIEITAKVIGMDQHNEDPASYSLEIRKAATLHGKGTGTAAEEKAEGEKY
jgi:hypothetical protein